MGDPVALDQLPLLCAWQELCIQPDKGPGVDYLSTQARKQAGCCSTIAGVIGEVNLVKGTLKLLSLEDRMQLQGFSLATPGIHKLGPNLHEGNEGNTPLKLNIAPENRSSQVESTLPTIIFQVLC